PLVAPYLPSFFFQDTTSPDVYTLSLHDALPILRAAIAAAFAYGAVDQQPARRVGELVLLAAPALFRRAGLVVDQHGHAGGGPQLDRKSTRLNSSHVKISYAVFCLKKKKATTSTG